MRQQAAFALSQIGDESALEGLTAALKDADRRSAPAGRVRTLADCRGQPVQPRASARGPGHCSGADAEPGPAPTPTPRHRTREPGNATANGKQEPETALRVSCFPFAILAYLPLALFGTSHRHRRSRHVARGVRALHRQRVETLAPVGLRGAKLRGHRSRDEHVAGMRVAAGEMCQLAGRGSPESSVALTVSVTATIWLFGGHSVSGDAFNELMTGAVLSTLSSAERQPEAARSAVEKPVAHDDAGVVDAVGHGQYPARRRIDQVVEVLHHAALPQECVRRAGCVR